MKLGEVTQEERVKMERSRGSRTESLRARKDHTADVLFSVVIKPQNNIYLK